MMSATPVKPLPPKSPRRRRASSAASSSSNPSTSTHPNTKHQSHPYSSPSVSAMPAPPSSSPPYQEITAPSLPNKKSSPTAKTHPSLSLSHVINHINSEPPTPELHSFLSLDSAITPKTATPRQYQHHTGHYPPFPSSSTSSYPHYPYPPGIGDNHPNQPIATPVPRAPSLYSTATRNSTWSPAIELPPLRLERLTRAFGGPGGDGEDREPSPSSASSYTLTPTLAGVQAAAGRGRVWDSSASTESAGAVTGGWKAGEWQEDEEVVVRGSGVFGGDTPPLREGDDGGEVEDEDERRMYWERELDLESVLSSARSSMMIVTPTDDEDEGSDMRSPALDALLKNVKVVQRESWRDSRVFGLHNLDGLGLQSGGTLRPEDLGMKEGGGAYDTKDAPVDPMDVESAAKLLEEVDIWLLDMKKRMKQLEKRHLKRGTVGLASA